MSHIAFVLPKNDKWAGPTRGELFCQNAEKAGHAWTTFSCKGEQSPTSSQIQDCDLIINHTLQAPIERIRELAEQNPEKTFINVNHSATAHLERSNDRYVARFNSALHCARHVPNVWYGAVDPSVRILRSCPGLTRCIHFPSPGYSLEPREHREPGDPVTIVMGGRSDPIKNKMNQLLAVASLGNKARLVLAMEPDKQMIKMINALEINAEKVGYLPHNRWIELLRDRADVVLSVSLAESFGFVASEAMCVGVPAVASQAVAFALPELVANPNDPSDIARKIELAVSDHRSLAERSSVAARSLVERNNQANIDAINFLLENGAAVDTASAASLPRVVG